MAISGAIEGALSGLRATQAGMAVVSQNVANAGTVGYTRRVLGTTQQISGTNTTGVNVTGAQRILDTLIQRQLRLETSGAAYTGVKASYHTSLDAMFDAPGGAGSLPTLLNGLKSSLSSLAANPSSYIARSGVISAATDLASSLNALSENVQSLRQTTEDALDRGVARADTLLQQIAQVSARISADPTPGGSAALLDQRDGLIDQLSELMDLKVTPRGAGIAVSTTGGLQLFDGVTATRLSFDARSAVAPQSAYSTDPAARSLGTITAINASGKPFDVVASGAIRSGEIAAYLELRDETLPAAQAQLDALAAGLAASLSDRKVAGAAATSGAAAGFDLDLAALQNGNAVILTATVGGQPRTFTFVKAANASAAAAAADGATTGIDFSGGMSSVASQIGAALGSAFAVSSPLGTILRILDDGAAGTTDVTGLSANATVTGLQTGDVRLPLFVDGAGNGAYTGAFEGGSQRVGFAGRIALNVGVAADPALLVAFGTTTLAGDPSRPSHLLDAISSNAQVFKGATAGSGATFTGTILDFANHVVADQAAGAASAKNLDQGQAVVLNAVRDRFSDLAGVNIDTEMTQLIQLQTAYGANARVMSAAKQMLDMLMAVGA